MYKKRLFHNFFILPSVLIFMCCMACEDESNQNDEKTTNPDVNMNLMTINMDMSVVQMDMLMDDIPEKPEIHTTFDESTEGWIVKDFLSSTNYQNELSDQFTYMAEWLDMGGVDGGYISFKDREHLSAFFIASEIYSGDLSDYVGGEFRFSLRTDFNDWEGDTFLMFIGEEHVLYYDYDMPADVNVWKNFNVLLDAEIAGWHLDEPNGSSPTQQDFDNVFSTMQSIRIGVEFASDLKETSSLDSVALIPPQ